MESNAGGGASAGRTTLTLIEQRLPAQLLNRLLKYPLMRLIEVDGKGFPPLSHSRKIVCRRFHAVGVFRLAISEQYYSCLLAAQVHTALDQLAASTLESADNSELQWMALLQQTKHLQDSHLLATQ